jgi:hypothetical protein
MKVDRQMRELALLPRYVLSMVIPCNTTDEDKVEMIT